MADVQVCEVNLAQNYVYRWDLDTREFYKPKAHFTAAIIKRNIDKDLFLNPAKTTMDSGQPALARNPTALGKVIKRMKETNQVAKNRSTSLNHEKKLQSMHGWGESEVDPEASVHEVGNYGGVQSQNKEVVDDEKKNRNLFAKFFKANQDFTPDYLVNRGALAHKLDLMMEAQDREKEKSEREEASHFMSKITGTQLTTIFDKEKSNDQRKAGPTALGASPMKRRLIPMKALLNANQRSSSSPTNQTPQNSLAPFRARAKYA